MKSDQTSGDHGRILVIDDELQIRRFLRISLNSQGYEIVEAENGQAGINAVATRQPDLVVLDLGLPDLDGKEVLREIRQWSDVPVLVLSVRDSETEKVSVLDDGANDYVTKPFGIQEFLARVRNLLRHSRTGASPPVIESHDLRIDLPCRTVTRSGEHIHLTPKEFAVLRILALNPDRVVTQGQLLREIWGPVHEHDTQYLRVVIGRLRQKLGDSPDEPKLLETEPGIGYRFCSNR